MSAISAARGLSSLIPPKIKGAAIIGATKMMGTFAKVSWNSGVKYAFKPAARTFSNTMKLLNTSKFAKAANIIGLVDLAGGFIVDSTVDNSYLSIVPGSGLVELGAALINFTSNKVAWIPDTNLLGAEFVWQ